MLKLARNTLFTVIVIVLTAFGLAWNNRVAKEHNLINAGQTVLAGQSTGSTSSDFPLKVSPNAPQINLGQTQAITISTVPNAQLEIITQYPDGSINHPQSFRAQANSGGFYSFELMVNDFRYLGTFRISVVASAETKTTQALADFEVTSWQPLKSEQAGGYVYPLVP